MTHYQAQPRDVEGYGFLSFLGKTVKDFGWNISKTLSNK